MTTATPDLSARMTDSLLTALTSQGHYVYGTRPTQGALIRRGLAEVHTTVNNHGHDTHSVHLTPDGRNTAAMIVNTMSAADRAPYQDSADHEALRLGRMGDSTDTQPYRAVTTIRIDGTRIPAEYAPLSPARVLRQLAGSILAGAVVTRVDAAGTLVRTEHLGGLAVEYRAVDAPADAAPRTLPGVALRVGEPRPAFADDPANPARTAATDATGAGEWVLWGWSSLWRDVVVPVVLTRGTLDHVRAARRARSNEWGMTTGICAAGGNPTALRLLVIEKLREEGRSVLFITKEGDGHGWSIRHAAAPDRYLVRMISNKPAAVAWRDALTRAHDWSQYTSADMIRQSPDATHVTRAASLMILTGDRKTPMPPAGWHPRERPAPTPVDVAAPRREVMVVGRALGAVDGQGRRATYDVFETDPARGMYVRHVGYVHPDGSETGAPLGGRDALHLRARYWTTTLTDYRELATPRRA